MFMARALNVVAMIDNPAMPGTITSRFAWSPEKIAPNSARKSSGRPKLKNAAVGLRQNIRRSSRYWCQVSASSDMQRLAGRLGGQLEVDVLQRRTGDRQLAHGLAASQRRGRQLVHEPRRVVDLPRLQLALLVAPRHARPRRRARAELRGGADGEDAPVLDDRHAVGERLRLVEVVRRQHDRLAEVAQAADRVPRRTAGGGVEARGRLVEEDELRVADQRQRQVQAPQLAAGQGPRQGVGLLVEADQGDDVRDVARRRVQARPVRHGLAHLHVAVHAHGLQDDAHAPAQLELAQGRVVAQHGHVAGGPRPVALEDLDRRRLARPVGAEQPEDLAAAHREVDAAHGLVLAVGLVQARDDDGVGGGHHGHDVKLHPMRCACIDIGSNTTRLLVAEPADGTLREVMTQRAFTRLGSGRGHDDPISQDKLREVTEVVTAQAEMARAADAEAILVVATAAIRSAANREELIGAIGDATGLEVAVLSGEDEASLAFTGATAGLRHLPLGPVGVADVGGGSSELVCGTLADGANWSASFRVGSGFLADAYLRSDPPSAAELNAVRRHAEGVFEGLEVPPVHAAFAVGGSATSL